MEHRHLTLMFTDIVGYSRLMGSDQEQTIAMLEDYRRILVEQIDKQQGTVIEFIGDAVFARFDTPLAGVTAAIEIQKALFSFNHFRDKNLPPLQTRIGLHSGEVATKEDAVFGDDVNIAARLEPIAVADGICVSEQVYKAVADSIKEPVLYLGVQPLKNIQTKIRAYLIRPLGIGVRIRGHYINRRFNEKVGAYRYAIAASVLFLIFAGIYYIPRWLVPGYDANYVEIADFTNLMNQGGEADYLSAGISEAVRAQLADMKDVYVLKSGEGVQAPLIIEGSVQRLGDNLRIAYQLKRRDGDVQIAGGKLDGKYGEIFILQDRVVGEIATYLADEFDIPNFRPARVNTTSDVLAYEYYMRGLEYLNKPNSIQNADEAIKFFTTALVHDADFVEAEASVCLAYRKKHHTSRDPRWLKSAEEHCEAALQMDATHTKAISAMGRVYNDLGEYEKSIHLLLSVLNLEDGDIGVATNLALSYFYTGQIEKALDLLNLVIEKQPKNWMAYHALGLIYLSNGDLEEAIGSYEKVLNITPNNTTALSNMGIAHSYLGDFKAANKVFEKANKIIPSSWAYSNIGTNYYWLGSFKKAKASFAIAIDLDPQNYTYHLNFADTLRQLKHSPKEITSHYKKAIRLAKKALELNADSFDPNYALTIAYISIEDFEVAENHLQKLISHSPTDPDTLYSKLRYEIALGEIDEAAKTLDKLLETGYAKFLVQNDPDLALFHDSKTPSSNLAKN